MAEDSLKILKHTVGADLIRYQADKSKLSINEQLAVARDFYKIHSNRHLSITNCLYMDYAALYLDSKKIKKVFGGAESWNFEYSPVTDHRDMKNHGNFSDFALDGQHPGPQWHQQIANEIMSIIQ
jgi:7-cyano-7-deazaguanine synthase in queuosine biosynthesis